MAKENLIFKLDNLEYQYHSLNGSLESFDPRLSTTRKLFTMKGRSNIKNLDKKLQNTTIDELNGKLDTLKQEIVLKKIHHLQKTLLTNWEKFSKISKNVTDKDVPPATYEHIIKSKIVKLCLNKILNNKLLKKDPPTWVQSLEIYKISEDNAHLDNPQYVYKNYLSCNKVINNAFSKFIGDKKQIGVLKDFENGMDIFLNINKEKRLQEQHSGTTTDKGKDNVSKELANDEEQQLVEQYDGMVALSEDEDEAQTSVEKNDTDYTQVTDLEPSDDEDSEEQLPLKKKQKLASEILKPSKKEKLEKKKKMALPALEYGFIDEDGYDDEESEDEDPFFENREPKEKTKNRKGQRQRRLLWEKKYGKEAKHVQVEITKRRAERETRQKEFDERQAKREERMKEQFEKDKTKYIKKKEYDSKDIHPSWEAKKVQEEKMKNIKFSGKKVVFD